MRGVTKADTRVKKGLRVGGEKGGLGPWYVILLSFKTSTLKAVLSNPPECS